MSSPLEPSNARGSPKLMQYAARITGRERGDGDVVGSAKVGQHRAGRPRHPRRWLEQHGLSGSEGASGPLPSPGRRRARDRLSARGRPLLRGVACPGSPLLALYLAPTSIATPGLSLIAFAQCLREPLGARCAAQRPHMTIFLSAASTRARRRPGRRPVARARVSVSPPLQAHSPPFPRSCRGSKTSRLGTRTGTRILLRSRIWFLRRGRSTAIPTSAGM
mmetsp:Transcript_13919/g.44138  ORF Transcript_13919/g.44138 Transcript_13919/m.44138 type:complete len:220 (+) Transcript_13919:89-748(+)